MWTARSSGHQPLFVGKRKQASGASQAWCCLHGENKELSAAQILAPFSPKQDADSPPESRVPEHIREAISGSLTGLLDEKIVGDELVTALWEASKGCLVFRADSIMPTVNKNFDEGLLVVDRGVP